ncbi:MAG TPA: proteasome-type protease [Stellaceae bacterium]|jgi:putative proteasome-type protease|nr:proteasome-type protease [Stellaceae bacterium]
MTYCVGLDLKDGIVLLSDTRTNAGIDHVSTFGKMHLFEVPGERVITLLTAGNLALSQAVVNLLKEGIETDGTPETLYTVPSMFRAAQLVGAAIRHVYHIDGPSLQEQSVSFDISILLGGQLKGRAMRLFQIYPAGNFIEATPDTPFLQIGEHKYGKPILDRAASYHTELYDGVKLVLVSMDSTLRSNLTVGMPIDLLVCRRDALKVELRRRITEDDEYFRMIRERWSAALRDAYRTIPRPDWTG